MYLAGAIPAMLLGMSIPALRALIAGHWSVLWHGLAGPAWVAWIGVVFLLAPLLTQIHRHRLRTTAGIDIPPQPEIQDRLTVQGFVAAARSQATWRQVAYHLIAAPALSVAAAVVIGAWVASLLCALEYLWAFALPQYRWFRQATYPNGAMHLPRAVVPMGVWLTLAGVAGLFVASWLTAGVTALDVRAARSLLGPSRAEELEHRVERLTQTRAGAVDAADAERRRLERDLHDGTQQRLVSLAINLGMARVNATSTEEAREALAQAHEEAKAALSELRDLIRGLHPAVLEDRGLDAALSGVAARMPIPVRLSVDLPRRPAPVIEAVAYFVVSEGLANIAKHAQASQAEVVVQRIGRPAAHHRQRRRRGRRRPGPRHRPGRAGPARRVGRRELRHRQPARRADPAHRGPAMQPVTPMSTPASPRPSLDVQYRQYQHGPANPKRPRGRWIWVASGAFMIIVLGLPITRVMVRGGNGGDAMVEQAFPAATRVVTIIRQVTSVNVQSYGGDIRVVGDPRARGVKVTEMVQYDPSQEPAPVVTDTVSNGQLTLAAPACDTSNCSVGLTLTVPSRVTVTAVSDGGNVSVSGVAGATLDSGSGTVLATSVAGPLVVTSGGGDQFLAGIRGVLRTDSGGGDVTLQGITGPAATMSTDGGDLTALGLAAQSAILSADGGEARIEFAIAPGSVDVTTDGGNATVVVPGGPYAVTADSGGGPESVGILTSPTARDSLTIITGGGSLAIQPAQ